MNLIEAVKETFSPGGVPEVPVPDIEEDEEETEQADDVVVSVRDEDRGTALRKIFALMRERRDADQEPHIEARQVLLEAVAAENEVIDRANTYSVEQAMQEQGDSFDRDELHRLRSAAEVSEQVIALKKQEIRKVTAEIDRIQTEWQRDDSLLAKNCENVANARRAAIVAIGQQGMHQWRLASERMVRELRMIQTVRDLLLKHSGDEALSDQAITELTSISIPQDCRELYWSTLSPRQQNDNEELRFPQNAQRGDQ